MKHTFREDIVELGYLFLREYLPGTDTITIAKMFGSPMTSWKGELIQDLIPRADAAPNTYSGIYGFDQFPFHTDLAHWYLPPRYLLLRCLNGYADIPTLLLDGQIIFDAVMLDILKRAVFKPRRPLDGRMALLRLCQPTIDGYRFRWDESFLKPASKVGEIAKERIRKTLSLSPPESICLLRAGDTLIVDNWRILHARSPIPAEREDRKIQRVYLENLH